MVVSSVPFQHKTQASSNYSQGEPALLLVDNIPGTGAPQQPPRQLSAPCTQGGGQTTFFCFFSRFFDFGNICGLFTFVFYLCRTLKKVHFASPPPKGVACCDRCGGRCHAITTLTSSPSQSRCCPPPPPRPLCLQPSPPDRSAGTHTTVCMMSQCVCFSSQRVLSNI